MQGRMIFLLAGLFMLTVAGSGATGGNYNAAALDFNPSPGQDPGILIDPGPHDRDSGIKIAPGPQNKDPGINIGPDRLDQDLGDSDKQLKRD